MSTDRRQKELNAGIQVSFSTVFCFVLFWDPSHGVMPPAFRVGFPSSVNRLSLDTTLFIAFYFAMIILFVLSFI